MRSKRTIAIDIDEVLAPLMLNIIKWHNEVYATSYRLGDFFTYDYWRVWGGDRNSAIAKVVDFNKTDYFKKMEPIAGSIESIKILHQKYRLVVVTSRRHSQEKLTIDWLDEHFPDCFEGVYFGNHYSIGENSIPKSVLCKKAGADIFIDDSLVYAKECAGEGIEVYLFGNYPWNLGGEDAENIQRVSDWADLVKKL